MGFKLWEKIKYKDNTFEAIIEYTVKGTTNFFCAENPLAIIWRDMLVRINGVNKINPNLLPLILNDEGFAKHDERS